MLDRTSEITALVRATDPEGEDPIALACVDPGLLDLADALRGYVGPFVAYVRARHRAIDRALLEAALPQVVLLGAGYDTRSYRLPGLGRVYEVDRPANLARKAACLAGVSAPRAEVVQVPCDFEGDALGVSLLSAGFDAERPAYFVWEGVTMYLAKASVRRTLRHVRALSAPGARLAVDLWSLLSAVVGPKEERALFTRLGALRAPLRFGLEPEDAPALFDEARLQILEALDAAALAERAKSLGPVDPACTLYFAGPQLSQMETPLTR